MGVPSGFSTSSVLFTVERAEGAVPVGFVFFGAVERLASLTPASSPAIWITPAAGGVSFLYPAAVVAALQNAIVTPPTRVQADACISALLVAGAPENAVYHLDVSSAAYLMTDPDFVDAYNAQVILNTASASDLSGIMGSASATSALKQLVTDSTALKNLAMGVGGILVAGQDSAVLHTLVAGAPTLVTWVANAAAINAVVTNAAALATAAGDASALHPLAAVAGSLETIAGIETGLVSLEADKTAILSLSAQAAAILASL